MMATKWIIGTLLLALPLLSFSFSSQNPTDQRLLVLLDDLAIKSSHSIFFKSLTDRGYELDFKLAHDPKLALQRYGQYLYDGLILFAPSVDSLGGSVDLSAILDFVDFGHDLILFVDTTTSDVIRDIAAECGVDFDEDPAAVVIDHTSYAVSKTDRDHTVIVSDDVIDSKVILGEEKLKAPVLFRGIAHSLNPANSLVLKVLSASPSAYSANPSADLSSPPALIGSSISLVSVVQARNNARVLISGSLDLFSNKHAKCGNEQFVSELSKWVFHERGHLKIPVRPFRHNEYERFIKAAYPYYGGAFSMMAGFFIFGLFFLYHK